MPLALSPALRALDCPGFQSQKMVTLCRTDLEKCTRGQIVNGLSTWAGANPKSGGSFQSTSCLVLSECDTVNVATTHESPTSRPIQRSTSIAKVRNSFFRSLNVLIAKINRSINQSINQSINRSINQSINQSISQSINQSINQSISRSINQSIS